MFLAGSNMTKFGQLLRASAKISTAVTPRIVKHSHRNVRSLTCTAYCQVTKPDLGFTLASHRYYSTTSAAEVVNNEDGAIVTVKWENGSLAEFPAVWLRDNCRCDTCWHHPSEQRLFLMKDLDAEIKAKHVEIDKSASEVVVTWPDDHVSRFQHDWLYGRRFTDDSHKERQRWFHLKPITWGRDDMQDKVPTVEFDKIMSEDEALYEWLTSIEQYGLYLIKGAPHREGVLAEFANRIAHLRTTNYGVNFTVKAKHDASNAAFTTATLGFHTDLPYFRYTPGVQMLHCIVQTPMEGGENMFADGFYVAEKVREISKEDFRILTTVPVDFYDVGTDYYKFHLLNRIPIVTLDAEGTMTQVTYNNQARDPFLTLPREQVQPLYRALSLYNKIMYQPENQVNMKLEEGDIICFHNYRVLHGRKGYQSVPGVERHLDGGFLDWDELSSRRRVLGRELGKM